MKVIVSDNIGCKFKKNEWFNDEILRIISQVYKDIKQVELVEGDKVLASIPTTINAIGEYAFMGWSLPFAKWEWFSDDLDSLILLEKLGAKEGVQIDVVNLLCPDVGLKKDAGLKMITVRDRETFISSFTGRFKKNIRRALRASEKATYEPVSVQETMPLLEYWFELYDNDSLKAVKELYLYWERIGKLKAYGIYLQGEMVGADYLLYGEDWVNGILTPWYKNRQEVVDMQIGYLAIVEAVDRLYKEGEKLFSLGDGMFGYKDKWADVTVPTYTLGLGRWEWREDD